MSQNPPDPHSQGGKREGLKSLSRVGLDTALFIYHLEENPAYLRLTSELFLDIEKGTRVGITSTITLLEIIVRPLSVSRPDIARKYEAFLVHFPNLEIIDLDRDIVRRAAWIRDAYHIRAPDAIQVSACLNHGAQAFLTIDRRLERLQDELDVILLDHYIKR
jgi:predicted nucleic acid-binding protein